MFKRRFAHWLFSKLWFICVYDICSPMLASSRLRKRGNINSQRKELFQYRRKIIARKTTGKLPQQLVETVFFMLAFFCVMSFIHTYKNKKYLKRLVQPRYVKCLWLRKRQAGAKADSKPPDFKEDPTGAYEFLQKAYEELIGSWDKVKE